MGVDGMSMLLMVLTTLLTIISLVSSRDSVKERKKEFILSIFLLETAMLGTFASLDVFFFYIFWELMLDSNVHFDWRVRWNPKNLCDRKILSCIPLLDHF
jgi:formate hydrogenlyase subunit 3/multisubunit Na+/H+ antiporter MnhD subunit